MEVMKVVVNLQNLLRTTRMIDRRKLDQFTKFHFSSLTKEEGWNRIEEYVYYQDDLWDEPSPSMNVSSISEATQPTLMGRLKRASIDNSIEGETKKEGHEGIEPSITQEPAPRTSILYQLSKTSNLPFPSRLKKQIKDDEDEWLLSIFKQIHINLPFLETMIHMPKGAKELKELISHKEKLQKAAPSVKLSEKCYAIIQRSLPQKEGHPGCFTLPCLIGPLAVKNALADLGENGFSGYFQIPIAPEHQEKTTFTYPYGTFTYKRMPFGLCNAPATFQRCMTAIVHELIEDIMEVFMDDFFVFGSSFDHCLKNLEKMLKRCEETNLVLNWEKCHFMVNEGIILGHKVSGSGIELVVKDAPFNFSKECIQEFDTLKCKLTHAPIMIKPDWSLPFEIMCDASDYAVGAVLGQRIDKHFKPIHYANKTMNEAQENYTTTEKELLAVVFAFEKFHQYLVLSKTIVFTDHFALRYLFIKQDAKLCLIRWILLLQEFDIEIRNKKDVENLTFDYLSRLEHPDLGKLTGAKIRDLFPEERLMAISDKNNEPCYADYANHLASRVLPF
nr:reverse transcriptase domain-containing protein [Tanacetum cinerariifolium]